MSNELPPLEVDLIVPREIYPRFRAAIERIEVRMRRLEFLMEWEPQLSHCETSELQALLLDMGLRTPEQYESLIAYHMRQVTRLTLRYQKTPTDELADEIAMHMALAVNDRIRCNRLQAEALGLPPSSCVEADGHTPKNLPFTIIDPEQEPGT